MTRWATRGGQGTSLLMGDGAEPEVFTKIAQVQSITPFPVTADLEDMTDLDSIEGFEDAVKTVRRTGEASLTINYDPSGPTHQALLAAVADDDAYNFKLQWPSGAVREFSALVVGFEPQEASVTGGVRAQVRIKPVGKPKLEGEE